MKFDNQIPPLARKIPFNLDAEENHTAWPSPWLSIVSKQQGFQAPVHARYFCHQSLPLWTIPSSKQVCSQPSSAFPKHNTTLSSSLFLISLNSWTSMACLLKLFLLLWPLILHIPFQTVATPRSHKNYSCQAHWLPTTSSIPSTPFYALLTMTPEQHPQQSWSLSPAKDPGLSQLPWPHAPWGLAILLTPMLWLKYCPLRGSV